MGSSKFTLWVSTAVQAIENTAKANFTLWGNPHNNKEASWL
jgi:hypothetical protein